MTLNDVHNNKNEVKVTRFELGLCLGLAVLCTKFCESLSNISSDIERKSFQMTLNNIRDLENEVKVTRFFTGLHLALVPRCNKFSETSLKIVLQIFLVETILNDLECPL